MPFLILLLCPEVHHILLAPIKSQTNLRVFMDFDMGRLEMRHNTFVYHRDQISANLHRFILNSCLNASIGSAVK